MLGTLLKALHAFSHMKSRLNIYYNFLILQMWEQAYVNSYNIPKVTQFKWYMEF